MNTRGLQGRHCRACDRIRKGQAEGTVRRQDDGISNQRVTQGESLSRVTDFGTYGEMYGRDGKSGVLTLADEAPNSDDFETALTEAKVEGNLSRANVARKAREDNLRNRPEVHQGDFGTVSRREGNGLQPDSRVEHRPSEDQSEEQA